MTTIAIIGVGNMGGAVLAGLVRAGHAPSSLFVGVRRVERGAELEAAYGVTALPGPEAAASAEVVILGVKPYDIVPVLGSLPLRAGQLVISLAAGITSAAMEAAVPSGVAAVRVMPNTPAVVGQGMTIVSAGVSASPDHVALVESLMAAVGETVVLPEKLLDAGAALSGSGPAYLFYMAESLIEAGVHLGLARPVAAKLVTQTLAGSSALLKESGEHPALLREQVTSPGGTTAAAIGELESHGVRAALLAATRANRDRSRQIAEEG